MSQAFQWRQMPGALEVLEREALVESNPRFDLLPDATTRSFGDGGDLRERWARLVDRLRGYRRDAVVLEREPAWIRVIDLHVPPGGSASLTYDESVHLGGGAKLKVFGVGFGGGLETTISRSIGFETAGSGKSRLVQVLLTATRYRRQSGQSLLRIDLETPDPPADRIEELAVAADDPSATGKLDPEQWNTLRRIELARASGAGKATETYREERKASWQVEVALPALVEAMAELALSIEVERSAALATKFELPYGHDYVLYARHGETPIAPRCAVDDQ